jgi:anti-sigma factor ChrR (cupin superfamily)
MNRRTDLTTIINARPSSDHLNAALFQTWEWQGRRRSEVHTPSEEERRIRRRERADYYGVRLGYDGE